jgi:hypothetical protein
MNLSKVNSSILQVVVESERDSIAKVQLPLVLF